MRKSAVFHICMTLPLKQHLNFTYYFTFNFPFFFQDLILAKYFNPFLHFLFFPKPTKKFSIESKLVFESSFLYFWGKNELCISNKTMKKWNLWERSIFRKKNQNPVCSIKIVKLWKTVSITPVYRYLFSV